MVKNLLIWVGITSLAILVIFHSLGQRGQSEGTLLPKSALTMESNAQIRDFDLVRTLAARPSWRVQASRVEIFEDQQVLLLEDLKVRFHTDHGGEIFLRGQQGRLDLRTSDFEVFGGSDDVSLVLGDQYQIATRSLRWVDLDQKVQTFDPVMITGSGLQIRGQGMEARLKSHDFTVLADVHTEIF